MEEIDLALCSSVCRVAPDSMEGDLIFRLFRLLALCSFDNDSDTGEHCHNLELLDSDKKLETNNWFFQTGSR